jgi:(p)ppGpp synthase/HD superfamily hydrolase
MIEALKPIFTDVTPERLAEMQDFQSMMGEVQDTEMFLAQLDKFTRGKESRAQSLASFRHWLLRRQTSQIVYCLKHADRLHRFWPLEHGPRREAPDGERKERQLTTR